MSTHLNPHKFCTQKFIAEVLLITAITWKQPSTSVDKWINKLWYFQTMKHYSAAKANYLPHMKRYRGTLNA